MEHEIEPVYNAESKILILGTFPSVKSREGKFFYHHPRNRFWKILSILMDCDIPVTIEDKKAFLLKYNIAVWDVIASCDIIGSSDSSIRNVVPNDLKKILMHADIKAIYANGTAAFKLYYQYCYEAAKREVIKLPSTSPANAAFTLDKLLKEWKVIL